jgi:hypothetical protein
LSIKTQQQLRAPHGGGKANKSRPSREHYPAPNFLCPLSCLLTAVVFPPLASGPAQFLNPASTSDWTDPGRLLSALFALFALLPFLPVYSMYVDEYPAMPARSCGHGPSEGCVASIGLWNLGPVKSLSFPGPGKVMMELHHPKGRRGRQKEG